MLSQHISRAWLVACALLPLHSEALEISLWPSSQLVALGQAVQVQVQVAGLGDGVAPSLGGYDLDLHYSDFALSLQDVVLCDPVKLCQLDLGGFGSVSSIQGLNGSPLSVAEVSLDAPELLEGAQADSFILFTATFWVLELGQSSLSLTVHGLVDAQGQALTASTHGAFITVPEPPVPALMVALVSAAGLAGLSTRRRVRRSACQPTLAAGG